MADKPRKPILLNVVLACMLLVPVYVLSYAPVVRWRESRFPTTHDPATGEVVFVPWLIDGDMLPFYRPVDWLIDNTLLRRPLFWWAGVWEMRHTFFMAAMTREALRAEPPPPARRSTRTVPKF